MKTNEIREKFLTYFKKHGHTVVPSSSLVPVDDPTLLFTNAGMVQFKDIFLGQEKSSYTRATSSQRCVRAGGKHNDLENVGYTARHLTFFEMLGNFSFGDYFKREAIQFAWNFLTQELKIPKEKLWVTVFREDDEAADVWLKEMKVDPKRFSRCDEKDNFWMMGDTGPCGPCSEIFYDHGPDVPGGPPGSLEADGDRYTEVWNLVFMQYNRSSDSKTTLLPKPSVDTGMGLERIAAVMQGVHSNYEIDIFRTLISAIVKLGHIKNIESPSLKVIADHIRSTSFLITDDVIPSNEGRGYVLRRIIRRAIRHGNQLGFHKPFFYKLVDILCKEMGNAYPELVKAQKRIEKTLLNEEEQFAETLEQGLKIFHQEIKQLRGKVMPGEVIFKLYDTYGFPADLTADIAREQGLTLDLVGFEKEMEKQKDRSKSADVFKVDYNELLKLEGETEFTGYETLSDKGKVIAIVRDNRLVNELRTGEKGFVVLDRTPFYAESGGQIGDQGKLIFETGSFKVSDTQKQGLVYLHQGMLEKGKLKVGMKVDAEVDSSRIAIMLNHSATHLLHAALRRALGEHVLQKGSLVAADRLRFDFAHFDPMTREQIHTVERLVNQQIRANLDCHVELMSPNAAKKKGALALFNEKYGDQVRVLSMGEFSMELCGGTHVKNSGEVGFFKIISETGIAAGIRRIEALTGDKALEWVITTENDLDQMAKLLKVNRDNLTLKLQQLLQQYRDQEKQLQQLQDKVAGLSSLNLANRAVNIGKFQLVATKIEDAEITTLRQMVDQLKQRLQYGVIILAGVKNNKISLVAGVSNMATDKVNAGDLLKFIAEQIGGKGGGRSDLAQGGGTDISALPKALESVAGWIKSQCL